MLIQALRYYASNPRHLSYRLMPRLYWKQYSKLAREQGIDQLYLVLSFDCDTDEDAEAAASLDEWLHQHGIRATYAVPGVQLERAADIYQSIARRGAEFMNHGGQAHAAWQGDHYISITFYNEMSDDDLEADIRQGHEVVQQLIGKAPIGFRAPHFGYVAYPPELERVHRVLRKIGYRYSSSTLPAQALQHAPIWKLNGIYEIPVLGSYVEPLKILDSWTHIRSPQQPTITDVYGEKLRTTVGKLKRGGFCGILNYYVDPAHVANSSTFQDALLSILDLGIPSLTFEELVTVVESA